MAKMSGGDRLKDRLEHIAANISSAVAVRVGFLENSTYPSATPGLRRLARQASAGKKGAAAKLRKALKAPGGGGTPVALVAAINEYGAPSRGQPPRPFFRDMIKAKSPEWGRAIAALLKANDYDARRTLAQTGLAIKGQLQESINTYVGPPLSPRTVAAKGFSKQLIDTSHMLNSVDSKVIS